jgi:3-hydroxyacyl-[acyl-carrier-protein] dehydratase
MNGRDAAAVPYRRRIEHVDTDASGVVHFSRYVSLMEAAGLEYLEERGAGLHHLLNAGVDLVVTSLKVSYVRSAVYRDVVLGETTVETVGAAQFRLAVVLFREDRDGGRPRLAGGLLTFASVDPDGRIAVPLPAAVRLVLKGLAPMQDAASPGRAVPGQQPAESTDTAPREVRALGVSAIKKLVRGRHPRLFIDRITDYEPGVYLKSLLCVSSELSVMVGHLPERDLFPGVFLPGSHLMQAFAQSGVILYQLSAEPLADDEVTLVGSVKSRFKSVVVPGDQVVFDIRAERFTGNVFFFSSKATVEDRTVAAFRGAMTRAKLSTVGHQLW